MDSFENLKSIWHSEKGLQLPTADEFQKIATGYKRRNQQLATGVLITVILCFIAFIGVWFGYKTTMWTTKFGELLIFSALVYLIYYTYKELQKKKRLQIADANIFLQQLKKELSETEAKKIKILQFLIYYGVAYGFFIYENTAGDTQKIILSYGILFAFIALLWWVYRPMIYRIHRKKVNATITKIEHLQLQINEHEKD
jgi:TRAP-type uncharacterized transport system fused permease subunit